jgi:hypothetical protein
MDRRAGGFQIDCSSEAAAQGLAQDLSVAFTWSDAQKPEVNGHKIIYQGSVRLLARFLTSRQWKLTMDRPTGLIFEREEPGMAGGARDAEDHLD